MPMLASLDQRALRTLTMPTMIPDSQLMLVDAVDVSQLIYITFFIDFSTGNPAKLTN
jgi:hypothetical protein